MFLKYYFRGISSIVLCLGFLFSLHAQDFTWMNGGNMGNQYGVYGTQGVPGSINTPGIRRDGATWRDNAGNLWLFGGNGFGAINSGNLNDLWKYTIATNQWTWVGGSNNVDQLGVYGTQGLASSSNWPGARLMAETWVDNAGNLWLFGGAGYGSVNGNLWLSDLWKYNIATNQWTWMKGPTIGMQTGTYGTMGVSAPGNMPGARECTVTWSDASGNFWLFGGSGYSAFSAGLMNDLWKYNVSNNEWTWVNGSNQSNQPGNYGSINLPSASNVPGARRYTNGCKDNAGNFWVFGGEGYGSSMTAGRLSDLWKFNPVTLQWTWVNGNNNINQNGVYGTQGLPNVANIPGGRQGQYMWADATGLIWMFGGTGFPAVGSIDILNDLWKYNISTNLWTWAEGSNTVNQSGVYGTQGVPSPLNIPGARVSGSEWMDTAGNLWLFGGYGWTNSNPTFNNDLWKYGICNAPNAPINTTPPSNLNICSNQSTTLSVSGTGTVTWYNSISGGTSLGSGNTYVTPNLTANVTYYAEATTCGPSANRTAINVVVNSPPVITVSSNFSVICEGTSCNLAANGAANYTWQPGNLNGFLVSVSPTVNTTYTITGFAANTCSSTTTFLLPVNALPLVSATSVNTLICEGQSNNIAANGALTYTWQPGNQNGFLISVSPTITTTYTVTGAAANGCENTATVTQFVVACTNMNEIKNTDFTFIVFPNPSCGNITIKINEVSEIIVMNQLGEVLNSNTAKVGINAELNLTNLSDGIYFIKAVSEKGTRVKKITIQH